VPLAAVSQASGQDQVWAIENGALVRRIVITGRRDAAGGRVEVLRGLAAEAQILAERFDNLKEGALAQVGASSSSAPATASQPAPAKSS
jgi:membrane fusion protein (multidrug efflux system)